MEFDKVKIVLKCGKEVSFELSDGESFREFATKLANPESYNIFNDFAFKSSEVAYLFLVKG